MQNEVKLLLELLPKYYAHVERYPHTLLIKFYGLYRVVPNNGSKVCSIKLPQHILVLWTIAARKDFGCLADISWLVALVH